MKKAAAAPRRQANDSTAGIVPAEYPAFLAEIKSRIRATQTRAALAANAELIGLYWDIECGIVERQRRDRWGAKVIDILATDLQREFPGLAGFSRSNIFRMRAFYLAWSDSGPIVAQAARQLPLTNAQKRLREVPAAANRPGIVPQSATQLEQPFVPQVVGQIPWFHNVLLIERISDPTERLWYAHRAVEHGWSRAVLMHQIETDLFHREGKAVTNFYATLPPPQSDLAQEVVKDPYVFDIMTILDDANERALETALLAHVERFLLELGAGFALVGRQVPLEVDGQGFRIDLLFYHLKLRCFVVIDLKARAFVPEYAGKMNFYLSAVDDRMRQPGDQPSIGLILCKSRNRVIAEYALRDIRKPVGVSGYLTRLVESLPKSLKGAIPTVAEIERELAGEALQKRPPAKTTQTRKALARTRPNSKA